VASDRSIPRFSKSIGQFLALEKLGWEETVPGTDIEVVAPQASDGRISSFGIIVLRTSNLPNGLTTAHVELVENKFTFAVGDKREPKELPIGTIMESGIACQHFPRTNASMAYLGGISVGRDYNFDNAVLPDGSISSELYVPAVANIYSFMPPEGVFNAPASLGIYDAKISQATIEADKAQEQAIQKLDEAIHQKVVALFQSEDEQAEITTIFSTFVPEARAQLASIMLFSDEDGVVGKYLDALRHAVKEEFSMLPKGMRGLDSIPSTPRGFGMLVKELGLVFPRPEKNAKEQ
jgi:hypothetical protein